MRALVVLYELGVGSGLRLGWRDKEGQRTLQEFLQPPPGSSDVFGGFHFHDQSNVTVGLPPVEKSPISSTLAFLCKLGSAWNSLVTKFSTSRGVEAYTYVRPLICVSTAALFRSPVEEEPWRTLKVNVNMSSSSLLSLRMKDGTPFADSGSCTAARRLSVWRQSARNHGQDRTYLDELDRRSVAWRARHDYS